MSSEAEILKNFPLLHKGRRMLVVDNKARHFDEDCDVLVWDRLLGCEVGFCHIEPDGSYRGWVGYGPHELPIEGDSAKELAAAATQLVNWTLKH